LFVDVRRCSSMFVDVRRCSLMFVGVRCCSLLFAVGYIKLWRNAIGRAMLFASRCHVDW